jgi:hypothetical protein
MADNTAADAQVVFRIRTNVAIVEVHGSAAIAPTCAALFLHAAAALDSEDDDGTDRSRMN